MTPSLVIQHDADWRHPEVWLDGKTVSMAAIRKIEYRYVPGQAAVLTVEYCVGGSHLSSPDGGP